MSIRRTSLAALTALAASAATAGVATGQTSHEGWPKIDGVLKINKDDGNDTVRTHFGRGSVDCGPGRDILYISHRARPGYKVRGCERISYKTIGH